MLQFSQIIFKDNFEDLKNNFKASTGKKWDENIQDYCSFVNLKVNNMNMQLTHQLLTDYRTTISVLFDKIDALNEEILKLKQ